MNEELLNEKSINEIASLLRYFVESGEHRFIEKMKDVTEDTLGNYLFEILFEARKRRRENARDEKGKFVPIPAEDSLKEFIKSFVQNSEEVKKAVLLLSLSRKSFEKEETKEF